MSLDAVERQDGGIWGALAALRRTFAPADHLALWTLTIDGTVAGSLMRQGDEFRLSLFDGEQDTGLLGAEAGDIEALQQALANRFGGEVRLRAVAA